MQALFFVFTVAAFAAQKTIEVPLIVPAVSGAMMGREYTALPASPAAGNGLINGAAAVADVSAAAAPAMSGSPRQVGTAAMESHNPSAAAAAIGNIALAMNQPKADVAAVAATAYDGTVRKHECAACANDGQEPVSGSGSARTPSLPGAPSGRLPSMIQPSRYTASLSLEPEAGTFSGRVKITATVSKATGRIVLHSLDLAISEARVGGKVIAASNVVLDAKSETVTLLLDEALKPGEVELELAYSGRMSDLMRGVYKTSRKGQAWAFSHLEPTHARRVMPSFDEPDFKAVFEMTVDAPAGLTPLSNMPTVSRTIENGRETAVFAPTPKMSSYLLAVYAAGVKAKSIKAGKTTVSVWAGEDQLNQANFALETARRALAVLEKYFGMPYQLPKLDLVAAPEFASGAMENWGAVLFRDVNVLVDPKLTSKAAKRRAAEVISHEIAHQWFGNLVTMKWWNDLWLNEAFATWVAAKVVDSYEPGWKVWDEFDAGKRAPLSIDALPGTRPVRSNAENPAEIQALFDPITYLKGGALLRMLEDWIGEADFRRGIQAYMKRHQYGNAEADDLWRAIEKVSGKPVRRVAGAWLAQAGVPVVSVSAASGDGRKLKLSQKRFSAMGESDSSLWPVPISIRYRLKGDKKDRLFKALLEKREAAITLPGKGALLWAYPNAGDKGYYRLALDARLLAAAAAHRKSLSAVERSAFLNNLWAAARAGSLPVKEFLDALALFKDDKSRVILEDAASYLKTLRQELAGDDAGRDALAKFAEAFFAPHAHRLGWAPKAREGDDAAFGRPAVLSALALHAPGLRLAAETAPRLEAYLTDPGSVDPAVAPVVLAAEARRNDAKLFERFRVLLAAPKTPEQRDTMLRALAEFTAPELLDRYLAMTLSPEVAKHDAWKPFVWLLSNPQTRLRAWAFVKANWSALAAKVGPRGATRIVGAASGLSVAGLSEDISSFFRSPANEVEMARKTLEQALSSIELSLRFQSAQRDSFASWASGRR